MIAIKILHCLQQNAEWMCAIAIALFSAVQCILAYQQNLQNIRMKRLELANELDKISCNFAVYNKDEAQEILQWLISKASNFVFLLNTKDLEKYRKLCTFLFNYHTYPVHSQDEMIEIMKQFHTLLGELDMVLGSANYGFQNNKQEFNNKMVNNAKQ